MKEAARAAVVHRRETELNTRSDPQDQPRRAGASGNVRGIRPPSLTRRSPERAPADLLFNGGIGTYIKAEPEVGPPDFGDRGQTITVRVNGNPGATPKSDR